MRDAKRIQLIFLFTAIAFLMFACSAFWIMKSERTEWEKSSDFMVNVSKQRTAIYRIVNTLLTIPYGVVSPEQKADLMSFVRNSQSSLRRFHSESKDNGNPFFASTLRVVESVYNRASQILHSNQLQEQDVKKLLFLQKNSLEQLDQLLLVELQKYKALEVRQSRNHLVLFVSSLAFVLILWLFIYRPFTLKYQLSQRLLEKQKEELLLKNKALIQTNRDLDRFAYVTSHDLKSPLRAINNLAEWIDEDSDSKLSEEAKRYFEILKNRVRRMERLINGILEYSRINRTDEPDEAVAIGPVIDKIFQSLTKSLPIELKTEQYLPTLSSNPAVIRRIFEHLIHNATQFNHSETPKIWVYSEPRPDGVAVLIRDNGPGIDGRFHGKVFEIFQTLNNKDEIETTGIGLAVVKKAMEQMGGGVILHNPQEGGTLVELHFPSNKVISKKAEQ